MTDVTISRICDVVNTHLRILIFLGLDRQVAFDGIIEAKQKERPKMSGIENNSRSIHFGPTKKLVCLPDPFRAKLPRLRCASLRMTRFFVFAAARQTPIYRAPAENRQACFLTEFSQETPISHTVLTASALKSQCKVNPKGKRRMFT